MGRISGTLEDRLLATKANLLDVIHVTIPYYDPASTANITIDTI